MIDIETCTPDNPRWEELLSLVAELGQENWFQASYDWHLGAHVFIAIKNGRVVGFLRCVVQAIGVEEDRPKVKRDGEVLLEGKVLAFGVTPSEREQGIGRSLQERLIADGRAMAWYQIRSFSDDAHPDNQRLKTSLGFGIHPLPAGGGKQGVYFILPLQTGRW